MMEPVRKLAAIMLTDIVGYSRLMNEDELGALDLLGQSRNLQKPLVDKHRGSWVKEMGDGVFLVFDSVVDAVWCAFEIHRQAKDIPLLEYKIVIHSGEVTLTPGDLFGDDVNQTARLEQYAEASSILISEKAAAELKNIKSIATVYLGRFSLKNITEPVSLYAIASDELSVPDLAPEEIQMREDEFPSPTIDPVVEEARSLIESRLSSDQLTVNYLSREVGLSRPQLYRRIRAATGFSPSDWIRELRLSKATELLGSQGMTVSEAAYQSGFNNLSYFSKCFRQRYGVLPSAYSKTTKRTVPSVPAAVNDFIGREKELADVLSLLQRTRLLTLTGSGGTGKTRLALELLRQHGGQFGEGAYFVQLAPVMSARQVIPKVAQVLRIQQDPITRTIDSVIQYIDSSPLLIVLDNFEHVMAAAQEVAALLEACPALKFLVTSRAVLNLRGETEYSVPQLEVPDQQLSRQLEDVQHFPSISLFVNRGRSILPKFELTADNVVAVIEICRRLDGLPLALELAAMRLKLFSPDALLKRLDRKLDILSSSSDDIPNRHKTLRSAIDWSYSLLDPQEQTLFRRLSIFSGGCTLEAAEEICFQGYEEQFDIVDQLSSLVDKSLIYRLDQEDGEPRFYMLETLKAYGQDRLEKSLERKDIQQKYVDHYQQWLKSKGKELTSEEQVEACRAIDVELDNIRALLQWAEQEDQGNLGLDIATSVWRFWNIRSMMREGHNWLTRLLQLPNLQNDSTVRCDALNACGIMVGLTGYVVESDNFLNQSVEIARKIGYKKGLTHALNHLSWTNLIRTKFTYAQELGREALEVSIKVNDQRSISVSKNNLAWTYFQQARLTEAMRTIREAATIRQKTGDLRGFAYCLTNEAYFGISCGKNELADENTLKALEILQPLEDALLQAWTTTVSAMNNYWTNNLQLAKSQIESALPKWKFTGTKVGVGVSYWLCAKLAWHTGNIDQVNEWIRKIEDKNYVLETDLRLKVRLLQAQLMATNDGFKLAQTSLQEIITAENFILLPANFELLADFLLQKGELTTGLTFLAWSSQFRNQRRIPLPPIDQPYIERLESAYQDRLSKEEYKTIWSQGVRLSMADCVAQLGKTILK